MSRIPGRLHFDWNIDGTVLILRNFPAMGAGASAACIFSTVDIRLSDAAGTTLTDKTFVGLPIVLGHDNPLTLNIP